MLLSSVLALAWPMRRISCRKDIRVLLKRKPSRCWKSAWVKKFHDPGRHSTLYKSLAHQSPNSRKGNLQWIKVRDGIVSPFCYDIRQIPHCIPNSSNFDNWGSKILVQSFKFSVDINIRTMAVIILSLLIRRYHKTELTIWRQSIDCHRANQLELGTSRLVNSTSSSHDVFWPPITIDYHASYYYGSVQYYVCPY